VAHAPKITVKVDDSASAAGVVYGASVPERENDRARYPGRD